MKAVEHTFDMHDIKAIIGLGNPGPKYTRTRHNIGFMVVDALADAYCAQWEHKADMAVTSILVDGHKLWLIKPLTYMNNSGVVVPWLRKKGISPEQILVVHDELEKPFGKLAVKFGGSARGHNGLRSLIAVGGPDFYRLRMGIGRPEHKDMVADWVLQNFDVSAQELDDYIGKGLDFILDSP